MIHNVDVHKTDNIPLVVINLSTDDVYLSKGEIMGFMQNQSLDILEIITETFTEPSPIILDDKEVLQKTKWRGKYRKYGKEVYYFSSQHRST